MDTTAVIVVDVQGDFTTWKKGALAVPGTDEEFVEKVRRATEGFKRQGLPIVATQDWHPPDHVSFFTNHPGRKPFDVIPLGNRSQILWPPHCVQGTEKAGLLLEASLFEAVVQKGADKQFDSYSGFRDDGGAPTGLEPLLKQRSITELVVFGIATDYCVQATALDAVAAGFRVRVVEELCRGVAPATTASALAALRSAGVRVLSDS